MKQRLTFGARDRRRDQRRTISVSGLVDGVSVDFVDLSFTGIGGGVIEFRQADGIAFAEGDETTVEFTDTDGKTISFFVTIQRLDSATGNFGATFNGLSDRQFDAIERMMFPRRSGGKSSDT